MKRFLIIFILMMIVGCGSNESAKKFQGVTEGKDYITEGMQYLAESDIQRAILSFDQAIKQDMRPASEGHHHNHPVEWF